MGMIECFPCAGVWLAVPWSQLLKLCSVWGQRMWFFQAEVSVCVWVAPVWPSSALSFPGFVPRARQLLQADTSQCL